MPANNRRKKMITFNIEITDTFNGESNYSWVKRDQLTTKKPSRRAIVQKAKAWAGFTGIRCDVDRHDSFIIIKPRGLCQILFINIEY